MKKQQFKSLIERTLKAIDLYSKESVALLMGTAAQESRLGFFLKQLGKGPALGAFQMEPGTFNYLLNKLNKNPDLRNKIKRVSNVRTLDFEDQEFNLALAICFCRLRYLVIPKPIPKTLASQADYWKKYYNSILGKGTTDQYIKNYGTYVGPFKIKKAYGKV